MSAVCCLLILGLAGTQSLGELARKEKKRRRANDAVVGTVTVYTNADIGDDEDPKEEADDPGPAADIEGEPGAETVEKDETDLEKWLDKKEAEKAAWRERLDGYQERYTEQKRRLAVLAEIKTQCDRNVVPVGTPDPFSAESIQPTWGVGRMTCESLPDWIAESEREMRAIEVECAEDARRHFIPRSQAKLY